MSKMRMIRVDKAVINVGVGEAGDRMTRAERMLMALIGRKPIKTISKTTSKELGLRKGAPIGLKVTLRGQEAEKFLERALWVKQNRLAGYSFDKAGNFSFGIRDYTDFEGLKYDPDIGPFGMDISVTLSRPGIRVARRRHTRRKIGARQRIGAEEARQYISGRFKVEVMA